MAAIVVSQKLTLQCGKWAHKTVYTNYCIECQINQLGNELIRRLALPISKR